MSIWVKLDARGKQIKLAKNAYVKALEYNKNHAKALQQLGWLHYKDEDDFRSAIEYLKRASEIGTLNPTRTIRMCSRAVVFVCHPSFFLFSLFLCLS